MISIDLSEQRQKGASSSSSKFLDQLQSKGYFGFYPNESWTPNVNLYETDLAYLVCVDLAGVDKQKIDIEVGDGRLTLRGNRSMPNCGPTPSEKERQTPAARVRIHLMEIDHGSFARYVELPQDVVRDNINARYENGLLWIELPKK
jgi:HSP20 family protein